MARDNMASELSRQAVCIEHKSVAMSWVLASCAIFAASVLFWWRALFQGKMVIHGDTIPLDLPMMVVQSQMLSANPGILWSDMLYGGFPLFAEGQAAFASPIKLALALVLDPISAMMGYHFIVTFLGAMGVLLLARMIGLSVLAALFSSVAVGFSMQWVFVHNNIVWAATLAVTPWVFLAVEHWLRRANLTSVLLLALSAAMMVLSGYPQFTHGAAVYIFLRVTSEFFFPEGRSLLRKNAKRLFCSGLAAVALALGLCAVQLIPLLELIPESHRQNGIGLLFPMDIRWVVKGLLFSYISSDTADRTLSFPSTGSALVSVLFLVGLLMSNNRRVVAQALPVFVLFNLGMQHASPLFSFIYAHHLVPGLHSFRSMTPYLAVAVIGIGLVAGGALDALSGNSLLRQFRWGEKQPRLAAGILVVVAIGALLVAAKAYVPEYNAWQLIGAIVIAPIFCLLLKLKRQSLFLPVAVFLLITESFFFRFGIFHLADRSVLVESAQAQVVKADMSQSKSWRVMDMTVAAAFGFTPPDSPELESRFAGVLDSLMPMITLLWQIPSIESVSALGLHRWHVVDPQLREEFLEHSGTPGARFIDVLGIRYITHATGLVLQNAQEIFHEPGKWSVYKNPSALPHFQLYNRARAFHSPEEVLKNWAGRERGEVFVESATSIPGLLEPASDVSDATIEIKKTTPTASSLTVKARSPVWLFMADADYPGWQVYVDGKKASHYSAQIMGKAVHLPAGESNVEFVFEPKSFYVGAVLSLISVLIVVLLAIRVWSGRGAKTENVAG